MKSGIVAFTFARGGSKGLPRKNLLPLKGKPLIVHAIEAALSVPRIERLVVSTDDPEIARVARDAGAEVPFLRPEHLSTDEAPEWLAWQHAIQFLRDRGHSVNIFMSIPCTAPLREPKDIDCCLDALLAGTADMVLTVREAERNPQFSMVQQKADSFLGLIIPTTHHRRQDCDPMYDITPVAYVGHADFILKNRRIFDGKIGGVLIPKERSIDIDTAIDFRIAELLLGEKVASAPAKAI